MGVVHTPQTLPTEPVLYGFRIWRIPLRIGFTKHSVWGAVLNEIWKRQIREVCKCTAHLSTLEGVPVFPFILLGWDFSSSLDEPSSEAAALATADFVVAAAEITADCGMVETPWAAASLAAET